MNLLRAATTLLAAWLLLACSMTTKEEGTLPGLAVAIEYGNQQAVVDLSLLTTTTLDKEKWVKLSEVFAAANLNLTQAPETHTYYIRASGGYRPESIADCSPLLPLDGTTWAKGYISPTTRNLKWDPSLQFPDCLNVENTLTFIVNDKVD